jgi:hypothetical protein
MILTSASAERSECPISGGNKASHHLEIFSVGLAYGVAAHNYLINMATKFKSGSEIRNTLE